MESQTEHKGACLCGAVRVSARVKSNEVGACHCAMCRKWGGGPLLAVECDTAVSFEGEDHITVFNSSDWAERGFCQACGTHLFYRLKEGDHYALPVGLFDDSSDWVFAEQIFIDKKPVLYSFSEQTKNLTGQEAFDQYSAS